jgi:hypothetical protein
MSISVLYDLAKGADARFFPSGYREMSWDEMIPETITQYPWSPIVFKDEYRSIKNFIHADWIALDFDDPETSLKEALKIWSDQAHIIGTTRNHQKVKHPGEEKEQPPCDRFRVLLQLNKRCHNAEDFNFTTKRLQNQHGADKQATDAARFFYPCTTIVSSNVGQPDLFYEELLVAPRVIYSPKMWPVSGKFFKDELIKALEHGVRPPVSLRNKTLYRAAAHIASYGTMSEEEIYSYLAPFFPTAPDFTEKEIKSTVRSAFMGKKPCADFA